MAAASWYESRRLGLGTRFIRAIDECTERLRDFPESCVEIYGEARRAVISGFPYALFYTYKDQGVRVVAVMHWRRDPWDWQNRINRSPGGPIGGEHDGSR